MLRPGRRADLIRVNGPSVPAMAGDQLPVPPISLALPVCLPLRPLSGW